jgi:hypothetical protein
MFRRLMALALERAPRGELAFGAQPRSVVFFERIALVVADDPTRRSPMSKWLRRIRGAIGMGLTWAAGWAPIGAVVGVALHEILPASPIGLASVVVLNATTFAVLGLIGGTVFGGLLQADADLAGESLTEAGRDQLLRGER